MRTFFAAVVVLGVGAGFLACSAGSGKKDSPFVGEGGAAAAGATSGGGHDTTTTTTTGNGGDIGFDAGATDSGSICSAGDDEDKDKDGFTKNEGDCNDCDPNVNPGSVEVIAEPDADGGVPEAADEDCDDLIDNVPLPCDGQLPLDVTDPMDGVRAMELCKVASGPKDWGVVQIQWVLPDGSPPPGSPNFHLGHGALTGFGLNVHTQAGLQMLALSSGTARQPNDPGYQNVSGFDKGYTCGHPQGFPKESPACPNVVTGQPHDGTGLQVSIRVPKNAKGFSFYFNFYTYEWPGYICSQYNDFFVALLDPIPPAQTDGNISFDSQGNPVSVNNAFLEVCGCQNPPPCMAGGKTFPCALGADALLGTGFGKDSGYADHAATSWLVTKAPIQDGTDTITMRFGVYDSGDGILDSTTLIDNWQWIAKPGTQVGTEPVPDPK
ncbi:MAG: choice-of-anchor L domain-containing protein [Deltaproteobacteria bacterium]|nr:choice-of-anchor L domain-containing protein [Deltaproteobacteria bacterium]